MGIQCSSYVSCRSRWDYHLPSAWELCAVANGRCLGQKNLRGENSPPWRFVPMLTHIKGIKGHAIWKHPVSAAVQCARFQKALRERPKFDRNERRRNGDCKRFEHNHSIQCWMQSVLFFPRRYAPNSILSAAGNSPGLKFGAVGCPVGCRWLRRSSPALCSVLGFSYQGCPLGISFRRGSLEVCSWTVTWLQMDSHNIRT